MNDNNGVLLEQIISQNQRVLEAVDSLGVKVADLPTRDELTELKSDVQIIKAAVTATNQDLNQLKDRVGHLETA